VASSPQHLTVVLYKLALVLLSAVIFYHLNRALFPYASPVLKNYQNFFAVVLIRRAIIVSDVILGLILGL